VTAQVQEEIVAALRLGRGPGQRLVRAVTTFDRPNLHYEVFDRTGSLGAGRALADAVARCRSGPAPHWRGPRGGVLAGLLSRPRPRGAVGGV
jgi:hypothetical protein